MSLCVCVRYAISEALHDPINVYFVQILAIITVKLNTTELRCCESDYTEEY